MPSLEGSTWLLLVFGFFVVLLWLFVVGWWIWLFVFLWRGDLCPEGFWLALGAFRPEGVIWLCKAV